MEDVGVQKFFQGTRGTDLERSFHRKVFCADEVQKCSVLTELDLETGEMLR